MVATVPLADTLGSPDLALLTYRAQPPVGGPSSNGPAFRDRAGHLLHACIKRVTPLCIIGTQVHGRREKFTGHPAGVA